MTSSELREKYLKFFEGKDHKIIPSAPLVPENDPTTLFNSAGMQPLIPYLLGQPHPEGRRLVDCQKCIRTGDIDEVGDTFHHTFFEMLGNWSLGDYFKQESIPWSLEFLTKELNVPQDRLWITVFAGDDQSPRDEESAKIWQSLGVPKERIFFLPAEDNWWAAGVSGPCGPDTEIFYDVTQKPCGESCRPGDGCGRFFEIWNNVFMVFNRKEDGTLEELPKKNVDTGMGLERTVTVLNDLDDNYRSDLFWPIIESLEKSFGKPYGESESTTQSYRIIADHLKTAVFLIKDGVLPGNKLQGYILRRLIRRAAVKVTALKQGSPSLLWDSIKPVLEIYSGTDYFQMGDEEMVKKVISEELNRFQKSLDQGLKEIQKIENIDGKIAFDLYQTYGFPLEITEELFAEKGQQIDKDQFRGEFEKHKDLSRTSSAGMFKGGLENQGEQTTKLHTATHLLHQALRTTLGSHVQQKGSNITAERLRFDFSHPNKLTDEEIKQVEELINDQIKKALPVTTQTMSKDEALKSGALAFFAEKYGDQVTVYTIGHPERPKGVEGSIFSREICGGPHVDNTSKIGHIKIIKEESTGSRIRRIYASIS
ncbi:MAG: alanine--tRNA ligase [Candidatus Daviesbacteria bacterium]|nr:alanine--tRNA ligase [Candidatus Daviesbacteria bacterium]